MGLGVCFGLWLVEQELQEEGFVLCWRIGDVLQVYVRAVSQLVGHFGDRPWPVGRWRTDAVPGTPPRVEALVEPLENDGLPQIRPGSNIVTEAAHYGPGWDTRTRYGSTTPNATRWG